LLRRGQVALAKQQAVGHGDLLHRFGVLRQLLQGMRRINHGDHAIDAEAFGDEEVFHQRVDHRRRVGQPGGFDDDAADRLQLAAHAAHEQLGQAARQIAAHGATDTAGIEHDQVFIDFGDQMVVDRNTAELVDQHGRCSHFRLAEQVIEQGRLACTKKASKQGNGDAAFNFLRRHFAS
jgi:hypothetical protein